MFIIKDAIKVNDSLYLRSELGIPFCTTYEIDGAKFEFDHSTGPEFHKDTQWIYKSSTGAELKIVNDAKHTEAAAAAYVAHKLGR